MGKLNRQLENVVRRRCGDLCAVDEADFMTNAQAQTMALNALGARVTASVKAFENLATERLTQRAGLVGNGERDEAMGSRQIDLDPSMGRVVFDCVGEEVANQLLDELEVARDVQVGTGVVINSNFLIECAQFFGVNIEEAAQVNP